MGKLKRILPESSSTMRDLKKLEQVLSNGNKNYVKGSFANTCALVICYALFFVGLIGSVAYCVGNFISLYRYDNHDYHVLTNPICGYGLLVGMILGALIGVGSTIGTPGKGGGNWHIPPNRCNMDNRKMWCTLRKMSIVLLVSLGLGALVGQFTLKSHEFGFFLGAGGMIAFWICVFIHAQIIFGQPAPRKRTGIYVPSNGVAERAPHFV